MAKVLLDVGAHLGETLGVALDPRWGFDSIHCFEPAPECWPAIEALADERTTLHRVGLWSSTGTLTLHDPGDIGASLYESKARTRTSVDVSVVDAAEWFETNLGDDDEVLIKINCEGAELEILNRLLDARRLARVSAMVVHFDLRKVPELRQAEHALRRRLASEAVPVLGAEQILHGGNTAEKTRNWLRWYHSGRAAQIWYQHGMRLATAIRVALWRLREKYRNRRKS